MFACIHSCSVSGAGASEALVELAFTFSPLVELTRADTVVFDIAGEFDLKVVEADFTRHDIFVADECFLTGTAAEIVPVVKADGRTIGNGKPGPITIRIVARFREMTQKTGTPIFD